MLESVREEFYRAAVKRRCCNDFVTGPGKVEEGEGNGCGSRRCGEGSCSALQGSDPLFEDIPGRVRKTGIDEARFFQAELVLAVLRVRKDVTRGLVDGDGPGSRRRIGHLPCMLLKRFEFVIFTHGRFLL